MYLAMLAPLFLDPGCHTLPPERVTAPTAQSCEGRRSLRAASCERRGRGSSPVVATSADRSAVRAEQHEDRTDDERDHAKCPQDRHTEHEPEQKKYNAQDDHVRGVPVHSLI